MGEFRAPGTVCLGCGTRASANTSGSDSTKLKTAGEIADLMIRTERRKNRFFCRTGFRLEQALRNYDPAV
jgi:hypothetical protein